MASPTLAPAASPAVGPTRFPAELLGGGPLRLCSPDRALDRQGLGWSRQPRHDCRLHGPWLRQKRWDAWGITSPRWFAMIGVMNLDYANLAAVYLHDRQTGVLLPFAGRHLLGAGCAHSERVEGVCSFDSRNVRIDIRSTATRIDLRVACGRGAQAIELDLEIERPADHESMNLVIPWSDHRYHFTSKQSCLPTRGTISLGQTRHELSADDSSAWLDFARGVWPYKSGWNWAMCSSRGPRSIGFNLGRGWTDGTGVTENALYVDGRVSKLDEQVEFLYDHAELTRPWTIGTVGSDRVRLEFTPCARRTEKFWALLIDGSLDQVIGTYRGQITTDAGETLAIDDLFGIAEDHRARW